MRFRSKLDGKSRGRQGREGGHPEHTGKGIGVFTSLFLKHKILFPSWPVNGPLKKYFDVWAVGGYPE